MGLYNNIKNKEIRSNDMDIENMKAMKKLNNRKDIMVNMKIIEGELKW